MLNKASSLLFGLSIFTLPWVGVGSFQLLTGRDLGGGLQPSWVFLLATMLACLLKGRSFNPKNWPKILSWILVSTLVAILVSGIGIKWAPSVGPESEAWLRWLKQLVQILIMLAFLVFAALWTRGTVRWQRLAELLLLGALFQVLYSLLQGISFFHPWPGFDLLERVFTSNSSILSGSERLYLNNTLQDIPRLRGTVCEPLYLGNYLLMVWPFLLIWKRSLQLRMITAGLLLLLLVLTFSRGSWIGFLGQLGAGAGWWLLQKQQPRRISRPWIIALAAALLLLITDGLAGGILTRRLAATFNLQDWSNLTRLYSFKAAWRAFLSCPLVGVGWGQFAFHFPLLVDPMGLQSQFSWPVVNNFPLKVLAETGLMGMALFVGTGATLLVRSVRASLAAERSPAEQKILMVTLLSVSGVWIQLLSFSQYNLPHIWVGLGLLIAALVSVEKSSPSVPEGKNT